MPPEIRRRGLGDAAVAGGAVDARRQGVASVLEHGGHEYLQPRANTNREIAADRRAALCDRVNVDPDRSWRDTADRDLASNLGSEAAVQERRGFADRSACRAEIRMREGGGGERRAAVAHQYAPLWIKDDGEATSGASDGSRRDRSRAGAETDCDDCDRADKNGEAHQPTSARARASRGSTGLRESHDHRRVRWSSSSIRLRT